MTPFANKVFNHVMSDQYTGLLREIMSGCQYFDCTPIRKIIELRESMHEETSCLDEMVECELPANHTWIEGDNHAVALSRDCIGDLSENGKIANLSGMLIEEGDDGKIFLLPFVLYSDGNVGIRHYNNSRVDPQKIIEFATMAINMAYYCIEAMQTPGGLCHAIHHNPTRQQVRLSERSGKPYHKWIEIRLGSGKKRGGDKSGESGRTVAWHYRRGHRINHPNPNYPKWRKGCWVGDTDAGIRTHNYIVEVPA